VDGRYKIQHTAQELIKQEFVELLIDENERLQTELEKYKAAIGYFEQIGYKDIIRNLLSY